MNISILPETFYPTPKNLIEKMYQKVERFEHVINILEPSAGKGDIACFLAEKSCKKPYMAQNFNIDCIEIDPNLRQNISTLFSKANIEEQTQELKKLMQKNYYELTEKEKDQKEYFENLIATTKTNVYIVADDFLTYSGFKQYDLIMMNPPFDNGDKHLLKAIDMMKNGGQIVCLLNAETLRNPFSNTRKDLARKLLELNADVEFLQNEFTQAERKTDVEIALIYINIKHGKSLLEESNIFESLRKAKQEEQKKLEEETGITLQKSYIDLAVENYNLEVEATLKLIAEYQAFKKYIPQTFSDNKNDSILKLVVNKYQIDQQEIDINTYLKTVRAKYWKQLFSNEEFTKALTTNLLESFRNQIETLSNFDFSIFNIKSIQFEISKKMIKGIEDTILNLFEELGNKYHWCDETSKNIHYYNGWKTNTAYKINQKVIIPYTAAINNSYKYENGQRLPYSYFGGTGIGKLKDIEKALNYLDGGLSCDINIDQQLNYAAETGKTSKIKLKYFDVTFYKKGTCHIVFTSLDLLDKLNLYGSQRKNWLPKFYGKKAYSQMTPEEKSVVDEFQGEKRYNDIVKRQDYFLFDCDKVLSLPQFN